MALDKTIFKDKTLSDLLEEIAENTSIKFYKRSEYMSSDEVTNDHFACDFLKNVDCDVLVQILPTSPLLAAMK